jgi:hypothetical protein
MGNAPTARERPSQYLHASGVEVHGALAVIEMLQQHIEIALPPCGFRNPGKVGAKPLQCRRINEGAQAFDKGSCTTYGDAEVMQGLDVAILDDARLGRYHRHAVVCQNLRQAVPCAGRDRRLALALPPWRLRGRDSCEGVVHAPSLAA